MSRAAVSRMTCRRAVVLDAERPRARRGRAAGRRADWRPPPPPAVDGLVVVSDHGEVGRLPASELQHLELGVVRVLELVHQHEAEAAAQPLERRPAARAGGRGCGGSGRRSPRAPPRRAASGAPRRRPRAPVGTRPRPARPRPPRRRRAPRPTRGTAPARRPRPSRGSRASRGRRGAAWGRRGRKRSRGSRNRRSRRKITCSGCESTRNCGSSPASSADSRRTRSPKAWKVEIVVSA